MAGNPWVAFLKEYRAKHKGESLKSAMKKASVLYRKQKGSKDQKTVKKKRSRK